MQQVVRIPHSRPEAEYSVTDNSILTPLLPTPLPSPNPHSHFKLIGAAHKCRRISFRNLHTYIHDV